MINDFYPGGVEKMVYELASRLSRDKFEISVLAVIGPGEMLEDFKKTVPVQLAGNVNNYRSLSGRIKWLLLSPIIFLKTLVYISKADPDVVVTSLYHADVLGIFAARLVGVKQRVIIQHDVHRLSLARRIFKKIFAVNLATGYVAISSAVELFLIDCFNIKKDKIKIIRNGIDVNRFASARKELDLKNIVVGSVGRLEKEKGYQIMIEALGILKDKGLALDTIIVGGGSQQDFLHREVQEKGVNIEWVGVTKDPVPFLKKMDVVIIPSIEEGFGLVILEALATEKIIIASDLPAIREILRDGETGVLFQVGNSVELASKLEDLLSNSQHIYKLKKMVSSWLKSNLEEISLEKTIGGYNNLLLSDN